MKNPLDPRHTKRQLLVQNLFKRDFYKQPTTKQAQQIFLAIEQIDKKIAEIAPEFPVEKINKTDLAILRLAIYELIIEKKEPQKVVLDEAIELAKEFGGESSPGFINGALGKLII
jgi:N utilization substance protein B